MPKTTQSNQPKRPKDDILDIIKVFIHYIEKADKPNSTIYKNDSTH